MKMSGWGAKVNAAGLLSLYTPGPCFHFFVKPGGNHVIDSNGVESTPRWIWGRKTERYDFCLEYLGLGPILLINWPPGDFWGCKGS